MWAVLWNKVAPRLINIHVQTLITNAITALRLTTAIIIIITDAVVIIIIITGITVLLMYHH